MELCNFIWLVCLCITHLIAYYVGLGDGKKDENSQNVVDMYEIDKKYEHLRWREERDLMYAYEITEERKADHDE